MAKKELKTQVVEADLIIPKKEEKVETAQEMAERLQKEVDEFKEKVSKIKTQEELDELEKEIMKELDEYDDYIKGVKYELPNDVVFEGTKYNKAQVAGLIVNFISRIEQTWQYVLGLYELCKLWKQTDIKEITFGALDSTLRLLDQQKFKGMSDWRNILIVNEYMKALHEQYAKDTTRHIALGHRHSAIISQRDLITPISSNKEE